VNNKRKECMTYKKSVFSHTGNGDFYMGIYWGRRNLDGRFIVLVLHRGYFKSEVVFSDEVLK